MPGDYQKKFSDWKKLNLRGINGAGVKVAVLDTGNNNSPDVSIDYTGEGITDTHGHGSSTGSIIKSSIGMANGCTLYNLKIVQSDGSNISVSHFLAALQYCIDNAIDFISMSFTTSDDASVKAKLAECYAAGCQLIASAGNSTTLSSIALPAGYPYVIAVNAVDINGNAPFKNGIVTAPASHGIDIACNGYGNEIITRTGAVTTGSGTSYAAPWFAAAAALEKQNLGISDNHKVIQHMLNKANKQPDTQLFGRGIFTF